MTYSPGTRIRCLLCWSCPGPVPDPCSVNKPQDLWTLLVSYVLPLVYKVRRKVMFSAVSVIVCTRGGYQPAPHQSGGWLPGRVLFGNLSHDTMGQPRGPKAMKPNFCWHSFWKTERDPKQENPPTIHCNQNGLGVWRRGQSRRGGGGRCVVLFIWNPIKVKYLMMQRDTALFHGLLQVVLDHGGFSCLGFLSVVHKLCQQKLGLMTLGLWCVVLFMWNPIKVKYSLYTLLALAWSTDSTIVLGNGGPPRSCHGAHCGRPPSPSMINISLRKWYYYSNGR